MTEKPRFVLELSLGRIGRTVRVDDPLLVNEKIVGQAWNLLRDFVADTLDDLGMEVDDEQEREIFIELCYKLAYREATTLFLLPEWEKNFKERLGKGKRIQRLPRRKGDVDDE